MILTEVKTVKIGDACAERPVFLQWLNKQGGTSYWLFNKLVTETTKTKSADVYERYISNLTTSQINIGITEKQYTRSLRVGSYVDEEDLSGLIGLFESPKVLYLSNPDTWATDGAKWQSVIIEDGSQVVLKTKTPKYSIEFDIRLAKQYNQAE